MSVDQTINYPVACKSSDIFSTVVEKLYHEYPSLRNKNIYFTTGGGVVNTSVSFEQNNIKNGQIILINIGDDNQ